MHTAVNCGDLQAPLNGQVTFSSTDSGSIATYHCNNGYILDGESERVCQESNGVWSGRAPTCRGKYPCQNAGYSFYSSQFQIQMYTVG